MDDTPTHEAHTWQALLEDVTVERCGQAVTVEIVDDDLGDQVPVHGLPLHSLVHDARSDVLVLTLSGASPGDEVVLRHLVRAPRTLELVEQPHGCLVLRIMDARGAQTLVAVAPDHASALRRPQQA